MKKSVIAVLFCAALAAFAYEDAKSAIAAAKKFQSEKKPLEAVAAYKEAASLETTPARKADALIRAGKILRWQKDGKADALKIYLSIAEDESFDAHSRTSAYSEASGIAATPEDSLAYLQKAEALHCGTHAEASVLIALGNRARKDGDVAKAKEYFQKVTDNQKLHFIARAPAFYAQADICVAEKDFAGAHAAIAAVKALTEKNPKGEVVYKEALAKEAEIFFIEEKFDEALEIAKTLAVDAKLAKQNRGRCYEMALIILVQKKQDFAAAKVLVDDFTAKKVPTNRAVPGLINNLKDMLDTGK